MIEDAEEWAKGGDHILKNIGKQCDTAYHFLNDIHKNVFKLDDKGVEFLRPRFIATVKEVASEIKSNLRSEDEENRPSPPGSTTSSPDSTHKSSNKTKKVAPAQNQQENSSDLDTSAIGSHLNTNALESNSEDYDSSEQESDSVS